MRPKAPGMKYTHYAPSGELSIVEKANDTSGVTASDAAISVADTILSLYNERKSCGNTVKILAPEEHCHFYPEEDVIAVGNMKDGVTVSARLYSALRECDAMNADYIYSESFKDYDLGGAIMNRLLKAAGQRIIHV
jgi:L-threonylcarbamoyladenylate synthase